MIAFCGLDCSKCEAYLATQKDDDSKRSEVAQKWSALYHSEISPGQINCDGCKSSGRLFFHCENSCEIRKCCQSKGVDTCASCSEYACSTLSAFIKLAPEAGRMLEKLRQ
ncbi:MAG: DUF3795 domain-containing protein [Deltaproteobacteria bacterium]|nr:DUF3795 domain-containing protein [Syntrophaceae bacterium]NLX52790.1 DUF3795 domain-containing protein [Deltaproteobacteria bacterium]